MSDMLKNSLLFLALVKGSTVVIAAPIYTWQDESGRTHFSDRPLNEDAQELETDYSIPGPADSVASPAQVQQQDVIKEQIESFYERRDAERQARLEEQRLKQSARAQQLQAQQQLLEAEKDNYPQTVYTPAWPYYGNRPYRRPHHHRPGVKPPYPGVRPPRPGVRPPVPVNPNALKLYRGGHHKYHLGDRSQYFH